MSSPFSSSRQDGSPGRTHDSGSTEHSSPPVAVPGSLMRPANIPQRGHSNMSVRGHETALANIDDDVRTAAKRESSNASSGLMIPCETLLPHIQECREYQLQIASTIQRNINNLQFTISEGEAESIRLLNQSSLQAIKTIERLVKGRESSVGQKLGYSRGGGELGSIGDALESPGTKDIASHPQRALPTRDWELDSYRSFNTIEQSDAAASISNEQLFDVIGALREEIESQGAESRAYYDCGAMQEAEEARKTLEQLQDCLYRFERHGADVLTNARIAEAVRRYSERRERQFGRKPLSEGVDVSLLETAQAAKRPRLS